MRKRQLFAAARCVGLEAQQFAMIREKAGM
jgi:hypothetical protein